MGPHTPGHLWADTHYDIVRVRRQGGPGVPPESVFGILSDELANNIDLSDYGFICAQSGNAKGAKMRRVRIKSERLLA